MGQVLGKGANAPLTSTQAVVQVSSAALVDLAALLVTASGKVRSDDDFVFYNQPNGPGVRLEPPSTLHLSLDAGTRGDRQDRADGQPRRQRPGNVRRGGPAVDLGARRLRVGGRVVRPDRPRTGDGAAARRGLPPPGRLEGARGRAGIRQSGWRESRPTSASRWISRPPRRRLPRHRLRPPPPPPQSGSISAFPAAAAAAAGPAVRSLPPPPTGGMVNLDKGRVSLAKGQSVSLVKTGAPPLSPGAHGPGLGHRPG